MSVESCQARRARVQQHIRAAQLTREPAPDPLSRSMSSYLLPPPTAIEDREAAVRARKDAYNLKVKADRAERKATLLQDAEDAKPDDDDDLVVVLRPDMLGNRFWHAPKTKGPLREYDTAEKLMAAAMEYFEWVANNPLYDCKVTHYQGTPLALHTPKVRVMTKQALCFFIGITATTYERYENEGSMSDTMEQIRSIMYTQKIEGASAGMLDSQIMIRELGLKDRTDITSGGEEITAITRRVVIAE